MKSENRVCIDEAELRAFTENNEMIVEGRAIVYDTPSRLISENNKSFIEVIERGAFKEARTSNAYFTYNHSKNEVLATVRGKSLTLVEDDKGVLFRAILSNTTYSKDYFEMIKRGDIAGNSFGMVVANNGDVWKRNEQGIPLRHISRISDITDISIISGSFVPAYPNTTVWARGFEEFESIEEPKKIIIAPYLDTNKLLDLKLKIIK